MRYLAVRGYRWGNDEELLKDFSIADPWSNFDKKMFITVRIDTNRVGWAKEDKYFKVNGKFINLKCYELPFMKDENMQIDFTCWKSFKKAMKILEKEGFVWLDGQKPTEWESKSWDKKDFSVVLCIWKKRSNGDTKRISWE